MELSPILSSLRRSPLGAVLITLQVALTLAIMLNAAGIVREHVERIHSVSGLDETNVFSLVNRWVGRPPDFAARVARDLEVIRATPGVTAAVSTNGVPLSRRGWGTTIDTQPVSPERQGSLTRSQLYYFDEQGADALGLRLRAGRWFTAQDIAAVSRPDSSGIAILTRALADHLFPDGNALGKPVYTANRPNTVIGIVDTLQGDSPGNPDVSLQREQYSMILPAHHALIGVNNYVVRTRPGAQGVVMKEVERRLRGADPMRVVTDLRPFAETRRDTYQANRALTAILVSVSVLLVTVTALGIAGLASYWVAQRQRMIGIRRALGASRADILAYFHSENLLIVGSGVLLGGGLAVALNTLLVKAGVPRIETAWLWGGAIGVLLIGQLAVFVPALRAARVPPALATRSG